MARRSASGQKENIVEAAKFACVFGIDLRAMKKAYGIFDRLTTTTPTHVSIREMCLYFELRRTVAVDVLFSALYTDGFFTLPQMMKTWLAFAC